MSRPPFRNAASSALIIALLMWNGASAAMLPVGPMQCHARVLHARQHAAATHAVLHGCCPGMAGAETENASHPAAALPLAQRPDCCSAGEPPARPRAYLIVPVRELELSGQVISVPGAGASRHSLAPTPVKLRPFVESIFAKKADLRI